jgi:hypothetical protein
MGTYREIVRSLQSSSFDCLQIFFGFKVRFPLHTYSSNYINAFGVQKTVLKGELLFAVFCVKIN